jgi:ABC-type lipoprotein export system ATPase subunit
MELRATKRFDCPEGIFELSVDRCLDEGIIIGLAGPSGSGKTTLLRCIAGLERPEEGRISFGGRLWLDSRENVDMPCGQRGAGFVFQDLGLFPAMGAKEQLLFARNDPAMAEALLSSLALSEHARKKPRQLSGGQQQRLAIARSLMASPRLLLLDEAFRSQDHYSKTLAMAALKRYSRREGATIILVSHDPGELDSFCDRVYGLGPGGLSLQPAPAKDHAAPLPALPVVKGHGRLVGPEAKELKPGRAAAARQDLGAFQEKCSDALAAEGPSHHDVLDPGGGRAFRGGDDVLQREHARRAAALVAGHQDIGAGFGLGLEKKLERPGLAFPVDREFGLQLEELGDEARQGLQVPRLGEPQLETGQTGKVDIRAHAPILGFPAGPDQGALRGIP